MRQAQINIKLTKGDVVDILQNERYFFFVLPYTPTSQRKLPVVSEYSSGYGR